MSPGSTESMIMSDLGVSGDTGDSVDTSDNSTTAAPAFDPAVAEEVAAVPGDEEVTEVIEAQPEEEAPVEQAQPTETDDQQKPEIPNLDQTRWQRVHSGYRWAREVGKALGIVGDDGRVDVTLFPSVDEIKGMRSAYSDRLAMEHDFSSARPENAQTFIENWNQFSPQGMSTVAAKLPDYLAQANPQGYQALAGPVIQRFLDYAYQSGRNEQDPERRDYILGVARAMEWWATGGYETGTVRTDNPQAAQPSAVEQELERTKAELSRRDNEVATSRWKQFNDGVRTRVSTEMDKAVDEALASLKPAYPNKVVFGAVRASFLSKLKNALQADTPGQRQYAIAREQAARSQRPQDQEALATLYVTMARRAIHSIRGPFVSEASKGVKQASDTRHAALSTSASKTAPTSGGAPRVQSIANLDRKSGETLGEFQLRRITHDLGA